MKDTLRSDIENWMSSVTTPIDVASAKARQYAETGRTTAPAGGRPHEQQGDGDAGEDRSVPRVLHNPLPERRARERQ